MLGRLANEVCDGRVVVTLEGGYDLDDLADLLVRHLAAMDEVLGSAPPGVGA